MGCQKRYGMSGCRALRWWGAHQFTITQKKIRPTLVRCRRAPCDTTVGMHRVTNLPLSTLCEIESSYTNRLKFSTGARGLSVQKCPYGGVSGSRVSQGLL